MILKSSSPEESSLSGIGPNRGSLVTLVAVGKGDLCVLGLLFGTGDLETESKEFWDSKG